MKRSRAVQLVLSGALASAVLSGCQEEEVSPSVSTSETYTNNHYAHGGGYYHAPYHCWFPFPYNSYQPSRGYYYGGDWHPTAEQTAVTASRPTAEAVAHATPRSTSISSVRRGGFGTSAHSASS